MANAYGMHVIPMKLDDNTSKYTHTRIKRERGRGERKESERMKRNNHLNGKQTLIPTCVAKYMNKDAGFAKIYGIYRDFIETFGCKRAEIEGM